MKTSYVIGLVIIVLIIAGVWWYFVQQNPVAATPTSPHDTTQRPSASPTSEASNPISPTTAPATAANPQATASISIRNFAFGAGKISVKAGTKVTWTNNDSVLHTVTSDSGSFDSGTIAPGETYSYVFNTPGTFTYHCTVHPAMKASVSVTP